MLPSKRNLFFIAAAMAILGLLVSYRSGLLHEGQLKVVFFDVGQGDSIFIETPGKTQILVDGGPGGKVLEGLGKNMPFWDRSIDFVILTHPEKDHFLGLMEVLKNYRVKNIVMSACFPQSEEYAVWRQLVEKEKANVLRPEEISRIELGLASAGYLEMLYPFNSSCPAQSEGSNEHSAVLRLVWGERSFLLTGDIGFKTEKMLIEKEPVLKSDVLKIAHHGSKYSTGEDFLISVSPAAAVISCSRTNSYGHPHFSILELLNKYDITVLRTDREGNIVFLTDGVRIFVKPQN